MGMIVMGIERRRKIDKNADCSGTFAIIILVDCQWVLRNNKERKIMGNKLYKYVDASYLDKVIGLSDNVTLKCSYPHEFNDPYELFLTVDPREKPKLLAFYSDVVGDIEKGPTTCFSRSPSIIPMWAHYARDLTGFVIEIDEAKLARSFTKSTFGDIDYIDSPDDDLMFYLHLAFERLKPRHLYFLAKRAYSVAYFTKASIWN